jgi:hypothetical protein
MKKGAFSAPKKVAFVFEFNVVYARFQSAGIGYPISLHTDLPTKGLMGYGRHKNR